MKIKIYKNANRDTTIINSTTSHSRYCYVDCLHEIKDTEMMFTNRYSRRQYTILCMKKIPFKLELSAKTKTQGYSVVQVRY